MMLKIKENLKNLRIYSISDMYNTTPCHMGFLQTPNLFSNILKINKINKINIDIDRSSASHMGFWQTLLILNNINLLKCIDVCVWIRLLYAIWDFCRLLMFL